MADRSDQAYSLSVGMCLWLIGLVRHTVGRLVFVADRSGQAYSLSIGLCLWLIGLVRHTICR